MSRFLRTVMRFSASQSWDGNEIPTKNPFLKLIKALKFKFKSVAVHLTLNTVMFAVIQIYIVCWFVGVALYQNSDSKPVLEPPLNC